MEFTRIFRTVLCTKFRQQLLKENQLFLVKVRGNILFQAPFVDPFGGICAPLTELPIVIKQNAAVLLFLP